MGAAFGCGLVSRNVLDWEPIVSKYAKYSLVASCFAFFLEVIHSELIFMLDFKSIIRDSPEIMRGFNFYTEGGREGDFYYFRTANGAIIYACINSLNLEIYRRSSGMFRILFCIKYCVPLFTHNLKSL